MSKKVLIIVENAPVPFDIRVWYEATTLRDAGWQPIVVCPAQKNSSDSEKNPIKNPVDIEGVTVYYFRLNQAKERANSYIQEYFLAWCAIARLSWQIWHNGRFDILHLCNPPDIFFPLALFYRLLGSRVIFDHHDLFPELVVNRYTGLSGKILHAVSLVTEFLTFLTAHVVISTNHSYRRVAIQRGKKADDRVIIVRNGPKAAEFIPVQPDPDLKCGFKFLVCYAGVMGYEDGVQELIESIRYVLCEMGRRDILFTLLGDGTVRSQAQSRVDQWGLAANVQFTGMIYNKELLRKYLCTADVCVSPEPLTPLNRYSTFIKIAEYMAMGKPVIAYDLEETRYTAQEAALYIEPGNTRAFGHSIVSLLDNPELREQMGTVGRRRILEQLCWEHQQQNLLHAYAIASGRG